MCVCMYVYVFMCVYVCVCVCVCVCVRGSEGIRGKWMQKSRVCDTNVHNKLHTRVYQLKT